MLTNLPLQGKTIILTGTSKTTSVVDEMIALGGQVVVYPLIETCEISEVNDGMQIEVARQFKWLIFTSQNAVEAFGKKMEQFNLEAWHFQGKIASIGERTTEALEQLGFNVSFMPSVYSADVFVKEFPEVAGNEPTCLFIRGDRAKKTLKSGLPFLIKEWTVYETIERHDHVEAIIDCIRSSEDVIVIFASPSAVDVYALDVAPVIGWETATIAAIGHITESALENYGATVQIKPTVYTMHAVLEQLIKVGDEIK
ncbi:MAG: uroporphyrinogen-III synthase [Lysinibacillus sp.]